MNNKSIVPQQAYSLSRPEFLAWIAVVFVCCAGAMLPHVWAKASASGAVQIVDVSRTDAAVSTVSASPAWRLDVNSATAAELEMLPGIGPRRAQAILQERHKRGSFSTVWDLGQVPGLNRALLQRLEPLLRAGPSPQR
ncbi:MAG TPA: ComEA family DNA-binding protein [Planctomycetota bacterium]|nr:ComEA family DNA-binding protein [Planctomycetota bacterium]